MTQKWHINDKGEIGVCRAEKGRCPFGDATQHFASPDEAINSPRFQEIQKKLEQEHCNAPKQKRNTIASTAEKRKQTKIANKRAEQQRFYNSARWAEIKTVLPDLIKFLDDAEDGSEANNGDPDIWDKTMPVDFPCDVRRTATHEKIKIRWQEHRNATWWKNSKTNFNDTRDYIAEQIGKRNGMLEEPLDVELEYISQSGSTWRRKLWVEGKKSNRQIALEKAVAAGRMTQKELDEEIRKMA